MVASSAGGHGSLIGATLGGFRVESLIGRGAMGAVYLARDVKLHREVALKVLLGSLARNPSVVKRFHQEAKAAAPLNHPNIVRVYAAGVEDGTPYIVMEFVDGEPLDRFLRRKGTLDWQNAIHIGGQVAGALDCAHRHGVVHCDVKPSNIMLDSNGVVRLADFGIANIQTEDSSSSDDTGNIGTPQYMSPEQCMGQPVGPASDLFSLGVTLYLMISGKMPFSGESSIALIKDICTEEPPRLSKIVPEVPDDVARLVAYLLEKEPDKRPDNARMVSALIARLQDEKGGRSAIPEAFSAFIKEEMEPRPFSRLHQGERNGSKAGKGRKRTSESAGTRLSAARLGRMAVVGLLALTALVAGPLLSIRARHLLPAAAPTMGMGAFKKTSANPMVALLYVEGFRFERVSWVGEEPVVVVETVGKEGTLMQGASGLLAVDTVERRFLSLRPPAGPALDPLYWQSPAWGFSGVTVPPTPADSPLHNSILMHTVEAGGGAMVTLAQKWNEATPRPGVLYRAPTREWAGGVDGSWTHGAVVRAVAKPDGVTVCLVMTDEAAGSNYLVERDVRDEALGLLGPRLTSTGRNIIPRSVQYSPDGSRIAYLRESQGRDSVLWVVASGTGGLDGRELASGVAGHEVAFSPDGRRLAVPVREAARGPVEIHIIDSRDGRLETKLGEGALCSEAWHASGSYLIVSRLEGARGTEANPPTGPRRQLWSVQTSPPYVQTQLATGGTGVGPAYALSRDGNWAAVVAEDDAIPTLLFLNLSRLGESSG